MWGQEIGRQEGLLELLNPCFCAVGRADYVELQVGENMYHIHQYWKLQTCLLISIFSAGNIIWYAYERIIQVFS